MCVLINYTVCRKWNNYRQGFLDFSLPSVCIKKDQGCCYSRCFVFLILLILHLEMLLSSPLNYLCLENLMWSRSYPEEAFCYTRSQIDGGLLKDYSLNFACWQANLKASLPFTTILSIMDRVKSTAVSSLSLWSNLITRQCSFLKMWVNCELWLRTYLQVNNIFPSR